MIDCHGKQGGTAIISSSLSGTGFFCVNNEPGTKPRIGNTHKMTYGKFTCRCVRLWVWIRMRKHSYPANVRHRAARRGAGNAAMRGDDVAARPTPSRQARCGQRRNAWGRRGSMSDTEPSGEVRATPQCVGTCLTYPNIYE